MQIVNETYYMSTYIQQAEKTVYKPGTRGNIYDCKGKLLAYDTLAYVVTIEDTVESSLEKNKQLNKIAYNTVKTIEKYGDKVIVDFPIIQDEDGAWQYNFTSDSAKNLFIKNIFGNEPVRNNVDYSQASAPEMINYLKNDLFEIGDYDTDMFLKIMSIRYNLFLNSYQKYVSTIIAKNVCKETVVAINENKSDIPGVKAEERNIRRYNDSIYFAPILGYTGTISDEELNSFKDEGKHYVAQDQVGKAGIELAKEDDLKGASGEEKIFVDSTGRKLSTISKKNSSAGNNVYLSIDSKLQKACYKLLEKKITSLLLSEIVNRDVKEDIDNDDEIHYISAKTVYAQLATNNVVNITRLPKHPSNNEKNLNRAYKNSVKEAAKKVKRQLKESGGLRYKDLSKEFQDYNDYIYDLLKNDGILLTSTIDTEDSIYQKYVAGKITTKKFLRHAITQNWINLDNLSESDSYLSSSETYNLLVNYIYKTFKKDKKFGKLVVKYRVYDGTINGASICLLLYDQNVLPMDKTTYHSLEAHNSYTTYKFITKMIKNGKITPDQLALDPCSGSVVITDPNTGKVKALVTYPSYDNNKLSGSVDPKYWAKLVDDQSDPLYNRATQGLTAPGSTFKMCTAMTSLENNKVALAETISCKGKYKKVKPSPKCWIYPNAHGSLDIDNAIAHSCNYFFYEMGYRLGKSGGSYDSAKGLAKMEKYATKLGLNIKSGVEIAESQPHFSTESSIHSAIGQGSHAYAPVQLARYVSTLANGGKNYQLSLIDKISSSNNKSVTKNKSVLTNKVSASALTWDKIHKGMRGVITYGTVFKYFRDTKVKIAAKTGTAQENKKRNSHALFVAYAPYKKPKIALSAVIPYGNSSHDSAELGKEVIKYYFGELKDKDINKKIKKTKISGGLQD